MSGNKDYFQYIQRMDIASLRSKTAWLNSRLKSTKLMTQLKHRSFNDTLDLNCEGAFDVLYLVVHGKKYYFWGKLVVIYIPDQYCQTILSTFNFSDRRMTFTYLKNKGLSFWLQRCKAEEPKKIILSDGAILKLFKTPFILDAVTDYDKDFRKEWEDGCLVYEGNEYGDTSSFYIIGYIDA